MASSGFLEGSTSMSSGKSASKLNRRIEHLSWQDKTTVFAAAVIRLNWVLEAAPAGADEGADVADALLRPDDVVTAAEDETEGYDHSNFFNVKIGCSAYWSD